MRAALTRPTTTRRTAKPGEKASDAARRRARLAKLEAAIESKVQSGDAAQYDAGAALELIVVERLYELRHAKLADYVAVRFPRIGYSTLRRYRSVAKRFTRASAIKHGMWKLWLGLKYLEATPEDDRPVELLGMNVRLADGSKKPFAKTSPDELSAAIRALGAEPDDAAGEPALPRGANAKLDRLNAELGRGLAADVARPRLSHRVVVAGARRRVHVTFHDVAIDELERFGRALLRAARS